MHNFVNVLFKFCRFFVYVLFLNVFFLLARDCGKSNRTLNYGWWKTLRIFLIQNNLCLIPPKNKFLSKKMELTWFYVHRWENIKFRLVNWRYSYRFLKNYTLNLALFGKNDQKQKFPNKNKFAHSQSCLERTSLRKKCHMGTFEKLLKGREKRC